MVWFVAQLRISKEKLLYNAIHKLLQILIPVRVSGSMVSIPMFILSFSPSEAFDLFVTVSLLPSETRFSSWRNGFRVKLVQRKSVVPLEERRASGICCKTQSSNTSKLTNFTGEWLWSRWILLYSDFLRKTYFQPGLWLAASDISYWAYSVTVLLAA